MVPELEGRQGLKIETGQVWKSYVSSFTMTVIEVGNLLVTWDGVLGGGYRTPLSVFENWTRVGSNWYLTNPEVKHGGRDQAAAAEDGRRDQGDDRPG